MPARPIQYTEAEQRSQQLEQKLASANTKVSNAFRALLFAGTFSIWMPFVMIPVGIALVFFYFLWPVALAVGAFWLFRWWKQNHSNRLDR